MDELLSGWENVSLDQRAIMINLKAYGFSKKLKPANMRTLDCFGTFENIDNKASSCFLCIE